MAVQGAGKASQLIRSLGADKSSAPTGVCAVLVERAREAGAPLTAASTLRDFLGDPQVAANHTVFESDHPTAGRVRYLRNPVRTDGMHPSLPRHPPQLGEHTDEVLGDLGYAPTDIAVLRIAAAVG